MRSLKMLHSNKSVVKYTGRALSPALLFPSILVISRCYRRRSLLCEDSFRLGEAKVDTP